MTVPAMIWSILSVTAMKASSAPSVAPVNAPITAASGRTNPTGNPVLPR